MAYNANGGTGAPVDGSSPYASGATVTVLGAGGMSRTGYTFASWNTQADGLGTSYAPAATFAIAANMTLYAQWTINLPVQYRSVASGDWNATTTWEASADGGSTWSPATATPTSADGAISVLNGHTVSVSAPVTVDEVTVANGGILALGAAVTNNGMAVDGTLRIDAGGSISAGPTYGAASLLKYNSGGTYGRNLEWSATSGAGYPANVQISNSTRLDLGANGGVATARQMSGNLTIDPGSTLGMNESGHRMTAYLQVLGDVDLGGRLELGTSESPDEWIYEGGSIRVGGNWTNSGGTLVPGTDPWRQFRRVTFNGTEAQVITAPSGQDFKVLCINKQSGVLELANDISVSAMWPGSAVIMTAGDMDLKGHTLTAVTEGRAAGAYRMEPIPSTPPPGRERFSSTTEPCTSGVAGHSSAANRSSFPSMAACFRRIFRGR